MSDQNPEQTRVAVSGEGLAQPCEAGSCAAEQNADDDGAAASVWKRRGLKLWRDWVRPMIVVVIVLSTFRSAVADWNDVPTASMNPTIIEGDRIFVNKLAYDLKVPFTTWHIVEWSAPNRGDIVVFFSPEDGTRLVKRVVGLPGDRIEVRGNKVTINGQPVDYEAADASAARNGKRVYTEKLGSAVHSIQIDRLRPSPTRNYDAMVVPAGHYFMMGDNRDNSRDSRVFGCVDRRLIVGRSSAVALSLDPSNHYLPRWGRFFHVLP